MAGERDVAGIEESGRFTPRFGADGLIPCICVDAEGGGVLMMAWMDEQALRLTLATGYAHYWSRSRQALWKKGDTSGALQKVVELRTDCDQDTVLLRVTVAEPQKTCHTGRPSCFYRSVPLGDDALERDFEASQPPRT